jgi:Tfp pilus assembly PilM family ATPase
MPQALALEWDSSEARLVVASSHGDRAAIEQAFVVALRRPQAGEDQEAEEVDVGKQIAAALASRGIGRIDTLVAVGRASIELRQLTLPPAPDDELPDLVRFQAMREFNQFDEDWLLDFMPLDEAEQEGSRSVLAAAIGPELVAQIQRTCEKAGLTPQRLVLRPCAAASLLGRTHAAGATPPQLLIDLLSDEADLTVMIDRQVVFLRTTRISGDPLQNADQRRALFGEIRRTIAAAENQLGGQRIEAIALCGSDEQHAALAASIEEELAAPTQLFDPFAGLDLGRELRGKLPEHPGRFAPLLGMALAELEQTGQAIDFLHPRHRPEPPSRRTRLVAGAGAAVLAVGLLVGYRGLQRKWVNDDVKRLTDETKQLEKEVTAAKKAVAAVAEVEKWTATDVVWLDELNQLSKNFLPARQVRATKLTLGPGQQKGGKITLEGLAAGASSIINLESRLRSGSRRVEDQVTREDESTKPYTRQFTSAVFVEPEKQ